MDVKLILVKESNSIKQNALQHDVYLGVSKAQQVPERLVLFRLLVPDGRLEAALLRHGGDDVRGGVRVDVLAVLPQVGVAEHELLHRQAGAHLKQDLETEQQFATGSVRFAPNSAQMYVQIQKLPFSEELLYVSRWKHCELCNLPGR